MPIHHLLTQYANQGIKLVIEPKRVKNINFRLKPLTSTHADKSLFTSVLMVSYPAHLPTKNLIESLHNRLAWAVECQSKLQSSQNQPKKLRYVNDIKDLDGLTLDSDIYFEGKKVTVEKLFERYFQRSDFTNTDIPRTLVSIYKSWLSQFIQHRQTFWQDKVGKSATKITPYTMRTRWGSCSTQAKMIRLSIWLAQFAPSCTDYVLVHELCHLHHANHSARFWACVEQVMPDYKQWHIMLKSGLGEDV